MKFRIAANISVLVLCLIVMRCQDDKELASIVGRWQGTEADFKLNLIPITSTELQLGLEFRSDGTVVYSENNLNTTGTYEVNGARLTIEGITTERIPVSVSGEYVIRELTDENLVIEGEREGEFNDPTYGNISGTVKAKLSFTKISP